MSSTLATAATRTPNPASPVCYCNPYRVGLAIGFWEPVRLVDVTRTPFCMVGLGGIQLDEGVNVIADVVNCKAEDLKVGMPVKPYWHPLANGEHLLMWQPDKDAA